MPNSTTQDTIRAITEQISAVVGSQIDGPFAVIRYPPGYHVAPQYHQPVYFNPNTLALIDQLCTTDNNGTVSMTGSRFSAKFAALLESVVYNISTADQESTNALRTQFNTKSNEVVSQYEANFGLITPSQISTSGCFPANKITYISDAMQKHYGNDPAKFPPGLAGFASVYSQWLGLATQLEQIAQQQIRAQNLLAACIANTTTPTAANGARQTTDVTWGVAYNGLPGNNSILASLTATNRTVTVDLELQPDTATTMRLRLGNKPIGSLALSDLQIQVGPAAAPKSRPINDLWKSAKKIEMQIIYVGLTVLRADPVEISADTKTGWFSASILSEIIAKTGHDVTGFQMQGSTFSTEALFGRGKIFARVKTFVISQEPEVTITFYGADSTLLKSEFIAAQPATIKLGDILSFGNSTNAFMVLDISHKKGSTIVRFGPPKPVGTTPALDQTAHIIGGVISTPPQHIETQTTRTVYH